MLAAYWAGPAYGEANIRLCGAMSPDLFAEQESHPADNARAQAIGIVLTELGFHNEAEAIEQEWQELVELAGDNEPSTYQLTYPTKLLTALAVETVSACRSMSLLPHAKDPAANPGTVSGMLNDAWSEFALNPSRYPDWERGKLERLRREFGI